VTARIAGDLGGFARIAGLVTRTVGLADLEDAVAPLLVSPREPQVVVDPAVHTPTARPQEDP
jgi:hypothetical protein